MFAKMSNAYNFSFLHIALLVIFFRCTCSAPIETVYSKFMNDTNINKCTSPEQIKLQSNSSTGESPEYLSSYLTICQNLETIDRKQEAKYLCPEILGNLKSILCPPISVKVIANSGNITLSKEVCKDMGALKEAVPDEQAVLKRLTDSLMCGIMCEGVFEKACQVLLWSYQLQPQRAQTESPKEAKEIKLPTEVRAVSDKTKPTEENKVVQKTAATEQQLKAAGETKQQSTNDLIPTIQKSVTSVTQQAQNQFPEQQSNHESNVQNPSSLFPKDPSSNILPMNQNNLDGNNSLDAGLPQVEINAGNQDIDANNAGVAEPEDPHDQAEPLAHIPDANAEPSQILDDKKSPGLPTADEIPNNVSPDLPGNGEQHLQAKVPNPNEDFVEPHDEEEDLGEVDRNETEPRNPVVVSETSKLKEDAEHSNLNNDANVQPGAAIQDAATTKDASTGGTTKAAIATTNKKVVADAKTPESESTDAQKTTEHAASLPSQKESVVSSVALTTNKESSSVLPIEHEKMDEDDDVHEMPADREPDQYTDLENTEGDPDDEYARQEYGRIYEPAKNREILPDKPNEVEVSKVNMRPREPSFDDLSLGEKYGRQSVFPEQEDGHFFFYFLTVVLILMAGYMLFHNKQKIIALIVEGRHERRRRSHGVGYKKLETK